MLEIIIIMILAAVLLVLIVNIRANIWYREELKCLDEVRKQYEKLNKEYEAELAEKPSEEEK